jgi:hypothetical protein
MSETINFISFVIFIFAFFALGINAVRMRSNNIKLKLQVIDLIQRNEVLKTSLDSRENKDIEKTEGFLNFVTQSRDWAFQYIEEVQSVLNKFINDIEPEIDYFKEYGDIASMSPNYYSMKKIAQSYDELKQLLPKETE